MTSPVTRIGLRAGAYETIASATATHLPHETGGILLGYQENDTIVTTHALVVNGQGATSNSYVRDDVYANALLKEFLEQRADDDPTGYVGEWHSHPSPSGPSPLDHAAIRATAKASANQIALLVHTPSGPDQFFGLIAHRKLLGRVATKKAAISLPPPRFEPLGPLPDDAVRSDGPVFISYRQSDGTPQADSLENLLRSAGLVVWRDHTDLRPGTTIDRLEQALTRGLSAGILVVTPDIVDSEVVRERELSRLLQLDADLAFSLCIANTIPRRGEDSKCDYDAPDRLLRLAPARTLADKKQTNMLRSSGELEIVHDLLMHRIEQRKAVISEAGRDFTIRVQTRPAPYAIDADEDDLHIRIKSSDNGRLPSEEGLELLRTSLPLTIDAVYAANVKGVRISGGAHLSIGLALGAALPETQFGRAAAIDVKGNAWTSAVPADDPQTTELVVAAVQFQPSQSAKPGHRVAVFVSLTPHADQTAFERLVNESVDGFAAVEVVSVGGSENIDPREAARLSATVGYLIKKLSASQGRAEVHLAFHGPYPMAVLIGRYLNTLRTVVYEWDGNSNGDPRYQSVIILEPGMTDGPITGVLA